MFQANFVNGQSHVWQLEENWLSALIVLRGALHAYMVIVLDRTKGYLLIIFHKWNNYDAFPLFRFLLSIVP